MILPERAQAVLSQVTLGILLTGLTASSVVNAKNLSYLEVGNFSSAQVGETFPPGWKPLTFENISDHTHYELVAEGKDIVVKAVSRQSSSGMTREITIDPREYPVVEWRWKVENILEKSDVTQKSGDDYPARLYITFEYDSSKVGFWEKAKYEVAKLIYGKYPPIGAITYIWESKSPIGTMVPNPYSDRVRMVVLQSGSSKLGQWVTEERNVYEDYQTAFRQDPPNISGVAIMTDTDNTQETAIAYYGDIIFKKKTNSSAPHHPGTEKEET